MITHHRSGHVILDQVDAKAISGLLRHVAAFLDHAAESGSQNAEWARATVPLVDEFSETRVPPKHPSSTAWQMDVPRSLLVDDATEWVHFIRGQSTWNASLALEKALHAKGGCTSEEWDLLSVAKMAAIRDRLRADDIEPLWTLLNMLGIRDTTMDNLHARHRTKVEEAGRSGGISS